MKPFGACVMFAALVCCSGAATASPIVISGSTYDVYMKGETSDQAADQSIVFGTPSSFARGGLVVSVSDSDVDLGAGAHRITINVSADGDLFPSSGEGAITGLGTQDDGLDLLGPVFLDSARITLFSPSRTVFTSSNLADDYRSLVSDPWDGFFFTPGDSFVVGNSGGRGINAFTLEFQVSEKNTVPEPASCLLLAIGLFGVAIRPRRAQPLPRSL